MADNRVIIEEINFGNDIPEWATKEIQQRILNVLEGDKKTGDKNQKETEKQTTVFKKIDERLKKLNETSAESSKKMIANLQKKGGDYTKDLVKKNLNTPFKSVNNLLQGFGKSLGITGAVLGAFATGIGFVIGRLKQFSDSFRQVFSMGFRFEQGAMGLAKTALAAEMNINQFTEILGKYSTTIGILGTDAFSELNVEIRDNLKAQGLLGMGLAELTEFTANYAEQLRGAGILQGENSEYLGEMATNYLRNITAFSTLANVSRDQINATVQAATSVEAFANRLGMLGPIAQRNVLQAAQTIAGVFAGLGTEFGDQLATTFTTAYGRGGLFFTEAGRQLLAVNKNLYNALSGTINNLENMNDSDRAAAVAAEMFEQMENISDAERERLAVIERSNTEYSGAARDQIALIRRIEQLRENGALDEFKDLQAMKKQRQQNMDETSIAFINFERTIQRFKLTFDKFFTKLFGSDRLFKSIGNILNFLQENADKFVDMLLTGAEKLGGYFDSLTQATGIGNFIARALGPIFNVLGKAITSAIVNGWNIIRMDLPGFLGGTSPDKKFAETFYEPMQQQKRTGTNKINELSSDLQGKETRKAQLERFLATEQAKGERPDDQGFLGKMFKGDKFYRDEDLIEKYTNEIKSLTTSIEDLEGRIKTTTEDQEKALALLQDENRKEFEKLFGNYDFDASMREGELVRKAGIPGEGETAKANETTATDPSLLSDAKMRIMKQYLPMGGSSDPRQDAEGQFYEQMIMNLKQIATNTANTTKAAKSTASAVGGDN